MTAVGGTNAVGHAVRGMTPTSDERWKRSMQAVLAAWAAGRGTPSVPSGT